VQSCDRILLFFFFFSSRRRHTRSKRDWSSDVCSSDLTLGNEVDLCLELHRRMKPGEAIVFAQKVGKYFPFFIEDPIVPDNFDSKIGRASCRERVWISVVGGAVKVTSRKKEEWHELMTE